MSILKAVFGCLVGHDPIYRRDADGKMAVECVTCLKKFPLPWANEKVPALSVAELERMMR